MDPHSLCCACCGNECNADNRCSECYTWNSDKWNQVNKYHLKLAAQREKKERKAKASSSFFGFSPLMPVPLMYLSSSFDLAVVSAVAASVDSYKVTYAALTPIVSVSLSSSLIPSTSAEPPR